MYQTLELKKLSCSAKTISLISTAQCISSLKRFGLYKIFKVLGVAFAAGRSFQVGGTCCEVKIHEGLRLLCKQERKIAVTFRGDYRVWGTMMSMKETGSEGI